MQEPETTEEDDGLGYYPDGVKRTLTDEQIAMFRHSEIYAIVRQRQLRMENQDVGSDDQAVTPVPEMREVTQAKEQAVGVAEELVASIEPMLPLVSAPDELALSDDEEEYVRFLDAEKEDMRTENARKKRKRNEGATDRKYKRTPTHRRLVRELDEVTVNDGILDYGDEPALSFDTAQEALQTEHWDDMYGRKPVVYADEGPGQPVDPPDAPDTELVTPGQGRKIWWPIIGT